MRSSDHWKERVKALKKETFTLSVACRHPGVPWYAKALALLIFGYALSPIDLIPDFIPVLGYLDDLILIPLGIMLVIRMIPAEVLAECRQKSETIVGRAARAGKIAAAVIVLIWIFSAALVTWLIMKDCQSPLRKVGVEMQRKNVGPPIARDMVEENFSESPCFTGFPTIVVKSSPRRPSPLRGKRSCAATSPTTACSTPPNAFTFAPSSRSLSPKKLGRLRRSRTHRRNPRHDFRPGMPPPSGSPARLLPKRPSILVYPSTVVPPQRKLGHFEIPLAPIESAHPIIGQAFQQGPVILIWDAVLHGSRHPEQGHNVVYHEFAHKLDMLDGAADGTPPLTDRAEYRDWVSTCSREYLRLKHAAEEARNLSRRLRGHQRSRVLRRRY